MSPESECRSGSICFHSISPGNGRENLSILRKGRGEGINDPGAFKWGECTIPDAHKEKKYHPGNRFSRSSYLFLPHPKQRYAITIEKRTKQQWRGILRGVFLCLQITRTGFLSALDALYLRSRFMVGLFPLFLYLLNFHRRQRRGKKGRPG